jgi:WD40 repeat protein
MRFLIVLIVISSLCPLNVFGGDVTYTGTHITGLHKWMYIQPLTGTSTTSQYYIVNGLCFDPTQKSVDGNYNRVYWVSQVNYETDLNSEGTLTTEGLYMTDIYSGVTSRKLGLATLDEPQGVAVDANGVVYAMSGGNIAEWVYKITNASSGDPTLLKMLGNNYSGADDDIISMGMVPQNFGGSFEAGKDIVLFDTDWNSKSNNSAVYVLDKDSKESYPLVSMIWQYGSNSGSYIRGAVNNFDGFAYFVRRTIPTADSGSGVKSYINRIKGDGILQRVFLNVDGGTIDTAALLDDSVAANPLDGSVWFYVENYGGVSSGRALYRVDAANATLISGNDYMANTTLEMTLTGLTDLGSTGTLNLSKNDMAFSPDGKLLVLATGDSYDRMFIFKTDAFTEAAPPTYGPHIYGHYKSFYAAPEFTMYSYVVSGLAFDATSTGPDGRYDKLYWLNRTDDGKQGLYLANVYSSTTSEVLALNNISEGAYDVKLDAAGNAFACYTGSSALYKVTAPASGSPTTTKMLGNYGFATSGSPSDDDPASIAFVPTGFGGGFTAGEDIIVFDSGLDMDVNEAVSIVDSTSTAEAQVYTTLWVDSDGVDNNIRGAASNIDGFAYIARGAIPTDNSGSGTKAYINRIKGNGVLQRVFINVGGGTIGTLTLDDAIVINPVDGSLWMVTCNTTVSESRYVYRVDVANATLISGTDYIANATLEISLPALDGMYNVGVNSIAFSPDGKLLAIGSPSGRDMIHLFSTEAFSAAPVNCADAIGKGYAPAYDLNSDCKVNFGDFAIVAQDWFECIDPANTGCSTPWE